MKETAIPGLHASAPEALPFAPSLHVRAFLLQRDRGNLLVYNAPTVAGDADAIRDLGGVSRQYLGHRHEAAFGDGVQGAPLFCHEEERDSVAESRTVDATFSGPAALDDDFQLIPIPGHTRGATAFLWDSGQHRCLFTGDTLYLDGSDDWVAAVLGSSNRDEYVASLESIRELEFDVLVPWAATQGHPYYAETTRADTRRRMDAVLDRVRRGEDR